jgi:translation initiation factor 2 beta subunit (eIF-2beta)/eIF-5
MMAQKEIVENRLEFLSTQQIQLQKLVRNEQIKTKKISEKYNEFVEKFEIEKEIKQLDDILIQRKV